MNSTSQQAPPGASAASADAISPMAKKALLSSTVGAMLEWYEFFIYGLAAALVFGPQFFPSDDPTTGRLLSLSTFAIAFVARPIGGIVFGHLGDRIGRKATLIVTLSMMGGATVVIGLLPTYAMVGIWAPILLVVVRLIQGLSLGGEFAGSILMGVEYGGAKRRGLFGGIVNSGLAWGLLLANLTFLAVSLLPTDAFDSWGWRIPFLLSGILLFVGLFIRLSVAESPEFQQVKDTGTVEKAPVVQVLQRHWRAILSAMACFLCAGSVFYVATVFSISYATTNLGLTRASVLSAVLVATACMGFSIPAFGALSDRIGRRTVFVGSSVAMGITPFLWFASLGTGSWFVMLLGFLSVLIPYAACAGVIGTFFADAFEPRIRYTGVALGYGAGSVLASISPIVATQLIADSDRWVSVAIALAVTSVVSVLGGLTLPQIDSISSPSGDKSASH
uniref:Putative proline/betaine transporter n=1 Tax=Rhodococcus sp. NS1 TaxID=402236 RepID=A0A097SPV8_9NOCA|nr:hypothetical protein LRS1606.126 [Rhodococcus sp. NS1]